MRYDITNIPIAEVFEEGDGCPICRLRNTLEKYQYLPKHDRAFISRVTATIKSTPPTPSAAPS